MTTDLATKHLTDDLNTLWAEYVKAAEQADHEAKDGGMSALTTHKLDRVHTALLAIEQELAQAHETQQQQTSATMSERSLADRFFERWLRKGAKGINDFDFKHLRWADPQQWKAMSLTGLDGSGLLASPEFAGEMLRQMVAVSPARQVARVTPLRAGSEVVPVRTTVQTAERVSETGTRMTVGTDSDDLTFAGKQLAAYEMKTYTEVSRWVLQDSAYDVAAEIRDGASRAFAKLEGKEFISGTGNGEMLGLDNTSLAAGNVVNCADSTGHTVSVDDVNKLLYQTLAADYLPDARLLINPKLLGTLRVLKAVSGNTYLAPVMDTPGTFLGQPYTLMPDLPDNGTPAANKNVLYLINPAAYRIVVRQDIVLVRINELASQINRVGFYVFARTNGHPVLPEALARLVTA